ncbi:lysylphosphatidylglycerol synthase transmembrane domain-containing protein [Balneolales bacterium ANBcel1]|nr:lysylphosphatidylglycerol synthase transmembrane domain-containing protein [Balneolales bacterium ANBcel1]
MAAHHTHTVPETPRDNGPGPDSGVTSVISGKYLVLSILLSLTSMGVLIYLTYSPGLFDRLYWNRTPGLFIALFVVCLRIWFLSMKIRYLSEQRLSWVASLRVVLCWEFTSSITPSTIGGGPMATYVMTREKLSLGQSSAIVIYGIMLDQLLLVFIIPLLVLLGVFFAVIPENAGWAGHGAMFLIYMALLGYALFLTYGVFRDPALLKRTVNFVFSMPLLRKYRYKIAREAEKLEEYSHELRKKPKSFLYKAFGLSTLAWLAKMSLPAIVILSFVPADVVLSFLRSMAMTLAGMFMPTPGGSGGVEGLYALFIGPLMERREFLGIAVFMWRIISFYTLVGAGMMAMSWYLNVKIVETKNNRNEKRSGAGNPSANTGQADTDRHRPG